MSQTAVVRITLAERADVVGVMNWLDAQFDQNYAPAGVESIGIEIDTTAQADPAAASQSPGDTPASKPSTVPPEGL